MAKPGGKVMRCACLLFLFLAAAAFPGLMAQAAEQHGIVPLAKVKFVPDEDAKCLSYAVESGDPDQGASTMILKAPPECVVP
jgi:hypothetical protein